MTRDEIIQAIEANEAKELDVRRRLDAAGADYKLREELQLKLRLFTVVHFGLSSRLMRTINGAVGRPLSDPVHAQERA